MLWAQQKWIDHFEQKPDIEIVLIAVEFCCFDQH